MREVCNRECKLIYVDRLREVHLKSRREHSATVFLAGKRGQRQRWDVASPSGIAQGSHPANEGVPVLLGHRDVA